MRPCKIHMWICEMYGNVVMSEEMKWLEAGYDSSIQKKWTCMMKWGLSIVNAELVYAKIHQIDVSRSPILPWCFLKFYMPFCMKLLLNACVAKKCMCMYGGYLKCGPRSIKEKHFAAALTFLSWCNAKGDELLNHIVTGDEAWISHVSMEWKHTASSTWQKFK